MIISRIIFLVSQKNTRCGYSLEEPHEGTFNEYPQLCFYGGIQKSTDYHQVLLRNSFGAKFQTKFVVCFFYFNKLSFGKTSIYKVKRLNVKQHRSR